MAIYSLLYLSYIVLLIASVIFFVVVIWRIMKALESIARSLRQLAENRQSP